MILFKTTAVKTSNPTKFFSLKIRILMNIKMAAFWDLTPYILAEIRQRF
jgi:hypothetical protein